jgi:hypothetical protein
MRIGEHGVRDHIRLLYPALVLVAAVWVLRLIMWEAGTPIWLTRLASVTVTTMASVLLSVILIHVRRFGGYASVVVASLLVNLWAQALIILAILYSILTGYGNVYSAPAFTYAGSRSQWTHLYGHITFGVGVGTLLGAAVGCLLFGLLRAIDPAKESGRHTGKSGIPRS